MQPARDHEVNHQPEVAFDPYRDALADAPHLTRRSKLRERSNSSQMSNETSPGAKPLTRTCVGVTASASATVGSVTDTRFSRSVVLIRRDLPTITRRGLRPERFARTGAGRVARGCLCS